MNGPDILNSPIESIPSKRDGRPKIGYPIPSTGESSRSCCKFRVNYPQSLLVLSREIGNGMLIVN